MNRAPVPTQAEIRTSLSEFGSATLGESGARLMAPRVAPTWTGALIAAPAFTVACTPGDNLAIHVAAAEAPPGSALVVDIGDSPEFGYWGEVLTTGARARGIAGLVIDGGVRDIRAIERLAFPVFSTTIALRGASKHRPGAVATRIRCGGASVTPGDWVVGDADGVVVVPGERLDEVVLAAAARTEHEASMFEALRGGATTLTLLSLDSSPVRRGESE